MIYSTPLDLFLDISSQHKREFDMASKRFAWNARIAIVAGVCLLAFMATTLSDQYAWWFTAPVSGFYGGVFVYGLIEMGQSMAIMDRSLHERDRMIRMMQLCVDTYEAEKSAAAPPEEPKR